MRGASLLAAGLVLAACAGAPEPMSAYPDRPDPAEAALAQKDMAYDVAESLVTEVGPRFSGSEGYRKAVEWALLKLTVLGFENVRAEPVTVPHWQRGEIVVEQLAPTRQRLAAVALGGSVGTPAAGIEAEVLEVSSVEALEKMPAAKVKGRIVFINGRMERTRDGMGYEKAVPARRKGPAVAGRKGARGVLIRSIGTDSGRRPHTGTTQYEADAPKIPAAALAATDADALEQALAKGKVRVRMAIGARQAGEAQAANVVGEIPGATPEIVLLGAHLDSWDITPGANDDAAGVGVVIAAARRVGNADQRPRRTIRVVLFANEEYGASGARAYAQAHAAELAQHAIVMEADSGSGAVWQLNAGVANVDWPWVIQLAQQLGIAPGVNGEDGGVDVGELRKLGVPELIALQDASAYFDVHHTADDTVDKLDRAGLEQASGIFTALALAASERPEAPGRVAAVTAPK